MFASDGQRNGGFYDLYEKPAAGGTETSFFTSAEDKLPTQISDDGRYVGRPAVADGSGEVSVPPPQSTHVEALGLGADVHHEHRDAGPVLGRVPDLLLLDLARIHRDLDAAGECFVVGAGGCRAADVVLHQERLCRAVLPAEGHDELPRDTAVLARIPGGCGFRPECTLRAG